MGVRQEAEQSDHPYASVRRSDLILRDVLAADRTVLANERTLLAYVRTALAFFATGAGVLHFFDGFWTHASGWALIGFAPLMLAVGIRRFVRIYRVLREVAGQE